MKEQVFKMTGYTATYHGDGRYTLKADEGYVLQSGNGKPVSETETKDYTQWKAVPAPADDPKAPKAEKAEKAKKVGKPAAKK